MTTPTQREPRERAIDLRTLVPEWIERLAAYPPGMPLEELEREYGITGSIKLASNENPFGPSPRALAALGDALGSLHRYPDGSGDFYTYDAQGQLASFRSGYTIAGQVVDPSGNPLSGATVTLYLAGSSIFSTGSHGNPTLTIVALAFRLADHLSSRAT